MTNKKLIPQVDYKELKWVLTDPDNFQYGRKVSPGVYQFKEWIGGGKLDEKISDTVKKEFDKSGSWEEDTIVLANFTDDEIRGHVSAYYDSLEALKEIYGEDSEWIIAECIFEQQSGLY